MRALVTGAAGFVGRRLCAAMLERRWTVHGTALHVAEGKHVGERVTLHALDIRNRALVSAALDAAQPDVIVHLAGITFDPDARKNPVATYEINVLGAAILLDEVKRRRLGGGIDPRVLVVGSGQQYGRHDPSAMPLPETAEQRPLTVYAASKAAQEVIALECFHSAGVKIMTTRSFNHSGAGQSDSFLLPALARRVAGARSRTEPTISIGNTSPVRDYLHVDDVVGAYLALIEGGQPGEAYNVSSGDGITVGELAERLLQRAGGGISLVPDPSLQRAVDVPVLVGDPSKLRTATGWSPRHSLDDLLDDLLRAEAH